MTFRILYDNGMDPFLYLFGCRGGLIQQWFNIIKKSLISVPLLNITSAAPLSVVLSKLKRIHPV